MTDIAMQGKQLQNCQNRGESGGGDITRARYLEPLAMVWITHLFNTGFNVNHAFKLLRK